MDSNSVKSYFEKIEVVSDYAKAVDDVGLWRSEEIVITKYVKDDDAVLELGCGAGRVGINLARRGFSNIKITDFSENMVLVAKSIIERDALSNIEAEVCDATKIPYKKESFDAVIFCFNGLMQIPRQERRLYAIKNIKKILKQNGVFIFTTHDRDVSSHQDYWESEKKQWAHGAQDPRLDNFGDIYYKGEHGNIFIHSPSKDEILQLMKEAGFDVIFNATRSSIAEECESVTDFSDDCLFWVVKKSPSDK